MVNSDYYFPPVEGDEWETVEPESVGWDGGKLQEWLAFLEQRASTGAVVLYKGRILAEGYWRDTGIHTTGDIASAQKSVVSLMIGQAQEDGLLKLDDPVAQHLGTGWTKSPESEERITIRHLITMSSGLADDFSFDAEPGTRWYYNNNAYHQSKTVLEKVTGAPIEKFTEERIFRPIGIRDS